MAQTIILKNSQKTTPPNLNVGEVAITTLTDQERLWIKNSNDQIINIAITKEERNKIDIVYNNNHTHSNKSVIDGITNDLINNWNTAYINNHTHGNKSVIDGITSGLISNWNTAYNNNHIHVNKTILDTISQADRDVLNHLFIVDNKLKIDLDTYSTGELSAFGAGAGGSGGGGLIATVYGSIDLGSNFSDANYNDTFNAYSVNEIYKTAYSNKNRILNLENGVYNKNETDARIAAVVNSAPSTLDTLNELSNALGNDPNFATTTANLIGTKLSLSGGQLTGQLSLLQGTGGGITFPNDSFGGGGDSASIKLLNPAGGEATEMTFTMTNDVDDIINFSVPSIDGVKINRYTVWNAGNFTNLNQLTTRNFSDLQNKPTTLSGYGITDALLASAYTAADVLTKIKTVDGSGSGLDADLLDGLHSFHFFRTSGGQKANFNDASTLVDNSTCYWTPETVGSPNGAYGVLMSVSDNIGWYNQLGFGTNARIYFRQSINSPTNFGGWNTLAFTTDNVASATKLQTARTIAGVNFDGTANIAIPFANLSSKPTTLSGYGITDALNLSGGTLSGNLSINTSLFSTATYLVLGQSDFNVVVNKGANSFYPNNTSGLVDLGLFYNRWRYLYTDYLCNSQNTPIHIDALWHSANDGSGSGLDADLLDGTHLKSIIGFDTKRDFINGTLITTDIDYSGTNGDPFYLEIKGNVYGRQYSCLTQAQGYIYADTIINYGVTHLGYVGIFGLVALNVNGRLCFWFPRQSYWEGYSIFVSSAYSTSYNRVIAIDDVAKPAGTKEVIISEHTSTSAFLDSNVASATKLQTTRTIWGQNFDGTGNVSGDLAMGGATISGTAGKIFFGGNFHIDSYGTYGIYLNHYNNSNVYINAGESQGYTVIGGNVGIGQIDPAYKLNVAGSLKTTGTVYTNVGVKSRNICIETDNDGNMSTASSEINNFNSTLFLQQSTSNGLAMCAGGGNVSIGTTYNGGYRLYVNGTSAFSSATTFYDDINAHNTINAYKNTPNGTTYSELGIQVYSNDGSPVGIGFHRSGYSQCILEHSGDGLVIRRDGVIGAGGYGNLTANAVSASIFNGNLNGNASTATKVYAETNGTNSIELVRSSMADNDFFRILVGGTASNAGYAEIATADDGSEPIYVRQYSGVFTSLVRTATLLDANGNTEFPGLVTANRFYTGYDSGVANSINCSNWFRSNGNTGWYNDTYGGGIYMTDSTYVRVYNNKAFKVSSTASDSINTDGGVLANGEIRSNSNITAQGELTAYVASDKRLKKNIKPINNALDVINKLEPVSYNWNNKAKKLNENKTDQKDFGLIAQDVEVILPEIVHDIHNDKYKAIDYIKLIPFLIKSIQELNEKVEKQQIIINQLQNN